MTRKEVHKEQVTKERDYRERHRFWTAQTLTQFGAANNFFIVAGFAMLGYFLNELGNFGQLTCSGNINKEATLILASALFTFVSLICGSITLLSRLYDLRLTRHMNMVRIKGYKEENRYKKFNSEYIDIRKGNSYAMYAVSLLRKFIGTLTSNKYFLFDKDISSSDADSKFRHLRERTLMLGSFSWMNFGWQIFWVSLAVSSYILIWII